MFEEIQVIVVRTDLRRRKIFQFEQRRELLFAVGEKRRGIEHLLTGTKFTFAIEKQSTVRESVLTDHISENQIDTIVQQPFP